MSYESFIIITISLLHSTVGRRQATLIYGVLKILAKKKKLIIVFLIACQIFLYSNLAYFFMKSKKNEKNNYSFAMLQSAQFQNKSLRDRFMSCQWTKFW